MSDETKIERRGAKPGERRGGMKKGYKAPHTLETSAVRQQLIDMYKQHAKTIHQKLMDMAESGDIQAIKELHERTWGKSTDFIDVTNREEPIPIYGGKSILRHNSNKEDILSEKKD